MSNDLKIEIFAHLALYNAWKELVVKGTELNPLEIYKDEAMNDGSLNEVWDNTFIQGIRCRMALFHKIYSEELNYGNPYNWKSLSDCYDHVTRVCDRDDLFGHLTIFERLLATSAYVLNLCLSIHRHSLINIINYGHIIWAMYFDKFTEQFYDEGGWNELKRDSRGYGLLLEILMHLGFHRNTASCLPAAREASINYCQFKKVVKYENLKNKQKGRIHISKLWIKFHIEHFKEYVRIRLNYVDSVDCIEIELLIQHLKRICIFLESGCGDTEILQDAIQGKFCSTRMLFSKTFGNSGEIKTHKDSRRENVRISEIACNEFTDSRICLETQFQRKCTTQSEKITAYEIIERTENMKKNSIEMEMPGNKSARNIDKNSPQDSDIIPNENESSRFNPNIKTSDKISDLDLNYENDNIYFDNEKNSEYTFSPRKEKHHYKLKHEGHALSSIQKEETKWNKNSPPKNLPYPVNFYSDSEISKSYNEREISKNALKSSFFAKNEGYGGNTVQSCAFSSDQMAVSQCERNEIPNKMSTQNDLPAVKEVTQNSYGKVTTNRDLDNLREEQADPNIRNFLRLILILGDIQGNHYLRDTLCNSEEGQDISQVKSKKGHKRSKNKPRK